MRNRPQDSTFDEIPMPQWDRWLAECRHKFGVTPREFDVATERMLLVNPPWVTKLRFGDALAKLIQNTSLRGLFRTGNLVWGHVIQANVDLFAPAPTDDSYTYDCPGELVFSMDSLAVATPRLLESVASELAGLRDDIDLDGELQPWADYLNSETTRVVGKQVPNRLSSATSCFVSTTLFRRGHLPQGVLCRSLFPVVVASQQPYFAMPLPQPYWPTSLLEWWSGSQS